jgi:glycolate oxidase iron-sulfur subunit
MLRAALFLPARLIRASGLAALGARRMPDVRALRTVRLAFAMLAATQRWRPRAAESPTRTTQTSAPPTRERVGLLVGCVQEGLFAHLNRATARVLEANGFQVVEAPGQECCGALHAHGGDLSTARALARRNVAAFERAGPDRIAVNTAGCGAAMKHYGRLLEDDPEYAPRAAALAARVRDVTELLSDAGPRAGAPVPCRVAYDHPCHLLHGQGVRRAPLDVLAAIPGVEVRVVEGAEECCGGAGIYGVTHPELGGWIGRDKVAAVRRENADAACTPNPGCMMQIGAGLRLERAPEGVVHPIELLDESYRRAGLYPDGG